MRMVLQQDTFVWMDEYREQSIPLQARDGRRPPPRLDALPYIVHTLHNEWTAHPSNMARVGRTGTSTCCPFR